MVETVVVTASEGSFPGLAQALKGSRVEVQQHPLIGFAEPRDWGPVDQALGRLSSYGAVALTSPRAAAAVAGRLDRLQAAPATAALPPVWAAGSATARALGNVLGPVRTPGKRGTGDGAAATLALAMLDAKVAGPVLFLCGETHREELPDLLRGGGIEVDEVVCYRSVLATEAAAHAASTHGTLVIVGSPAVADLLARACPPDSRPDLLAVGPTTATAARASGWPPVAVAVEPTAEAVAAAVRNVLATRSSHD
jgi:uroporphyrinogen-III synthase